MQSNRIVVVLAADGVSGLDISYGKNINTMYLNSHLNNEFVVRPNFLLGASETMWVTFTKGDVSTKPLMLVQRKTTLENSTRQVVDGTESTIEQTPDTGYEYYLTMPDVVLQNVGQWSFSLTISELPVDVTYKGTVATVAALPSGGVLGDTYWVSGTSQYEYWNGSAWAVLNIVAISTSDVGTITVNASVAGDIGGTATDLDIQVLYSFVVGVLNNLSDYLPKIVNGYWYVWNSDTKGFVNSGEAASSLMYLNTLNDLEPPQVGDGIITRPANFNRVPIIGETFTVVFSNRGNTYICLMKYTDEGQNLSRYLYVGNTRGAQGKQGIQGEKGEKGDTGVGIASVTQQVVSGGTQITITLTDGTSTSFIVSNGDVSNVQSLEFPYGDPVVTYDTTDGLHVHADLRVVVNGVTNDIPLDLEIPQIADDGLTEDATADGKKAVIKTDETVVRTNKANQIINGNVTIGGNVTVNGTVTSVSAQNLKVKNKLIVVAEGNTVTLTSPAGLLAPKYDGTNNGALVFDGTGTAYVGDVVLMADGDIDVAKSDLQPLATRGTLVNGNIVKWNGEKLRLEDTGIAAGDVAKKSDLGKVGNFIYKSNYESATVPTVGQVLTLTNANFSRTPIVGDVFQLMEVVNTKDTYANNMEILTVGDTTCTAKIMSFTDITSGKLDKTVGETTLPQAYVKNADGTQGMTNIGGTADNDIATKKQVADAVSAAEPYHFTYEWVTVLTAEQKAGIQNDPNCYFFVTQSDGVTYQYRRAAVEGNRYYFMAMHAYTQYEPGGIINVGQVSVEITTGNDIIGSEEIYAENVKNKTDVLNAQSTNKQYPTAKATYDADQATLTAANNYTDTAIAGVSSFEEITYSALKAKRDAGTLVKGKWYRITDYTCTTIQEDTQSAGHVFDIIVRADSTNVLNENAYSALHSGDTYFANCKLAAWQLKYSLDNDTEKFAWADSTNGKGVIYYMKDEWNNECPYDFKNIQFKRYKIASSTNHPELVGSWGIMSGHDYTVDYSNTQFFYTFAYFDDVESPNVMYDATLKGNDGTLIGEGGVFGVYGNVIAETSAVKFELLGYSYEMKTALPNTVIYGTQSHMQGIYTGFHCNVFGSNCIENTFADDCSGNIFANDCSDNTFGNGCSLNIVGNNFINNTFGGGCYGNRFGNNCNGNTIKSGSYVNTFGNDCSFNELQGHDNTFGNGCRNNKFGDNCNYNALGNGCYSNTFGDSCSYNIFGNHCTINTFGNSCIYNTFSNGCQENTINVQLQNCFLNDGVQYVKFTSSASATVQSVTVESGVVGSSFSNLLELYDADIANKTYPITITRESGANGKYLMKWNVNGACETGKYKATATAASWTPFTADMKSTSEGYVDTAIANAITTALNTPV